jgi:hypothetical protein
MKYSKEKIDSLSKREIKELNKKANKSKLSDAAEAIIYQAEVDNASIKRILESDEKP